MKPHVPTLLLPLAILGASSSPTAQFGGTGADGPLLPTSDMTLDTDTASNEGEFHFTDVFIPNNVTVTLVGSRAAKLFATGDVQIDGSLIVSPGTCGSPDYSGSPGWSPNGDASHAVGLYDPQTAYDSQFVELPIGGSWSNYSSNIKGGGFLEIASFGSILVNGSVRTDVTNVNNRWGSGGSLILRALDDPIIAGQNSLLSAGGPTNNENGYLRIESNLSPSLLGAAFPPASVGAPHRVLDRHWAVSQTSPYSLTETQPALGVLSTSTLPGEAFGVCTTLRGTRWVTFPELDRVHPYGRDGRDLLPGKVYGTKPEPRGIAADRLDYLWVACAGSGSTGYLDQLDSWGRLLQSVSLQGNPCGVAVDPTDRVWVTCELSGIVHHVDRDGTVLGSYPVGDSPRGIAIDQYGDVWVALAGAFGAPEGSLVKLAPDGTVLGSWMAGPRPLGVAVDARDRVWVTNEGTTTTPGNTVRAFDTSGNPLGTYTVGTAPTAVSIAGDGSVWVVNTGTPVAPTSSVMRLNPNDGTILEQHAVSDLSTAFGDATGYQTAMLHDTLGDLDGDGDGNLAEMLFPGNPFDPLVPSSVGIPPLSSIQPNGDLLAGGATISIFGGPFTSTWDTSVQIGGIPATNVQVATATMVTATTGTSLQQGRFDVQVTNSSGTSTLPGGFYYSNVVLSSDPPDGVVSAPGVLKIEFKSLPYTPVFLAVAVGVGTTPFLGLTLEVPSPLTVIVDPFTSPFGATTDGNGDLTVQLGVPAGPGFVGTQYSFASAILDPSCPPAGLCLSNGVVVTIQ